MDYTTVLAKATQTLEQRKDRSAWGRGVNGYACLTRSSGCGTIGMEGGAGLLSVVLLIVWFPLAVLADVVRKSK